eukprot:4817445-Pyramimonas_sp.AAC.1
MMRKAEEEEMRVEPTDSAAAAASSAPASASALHSREAAEEEEEKDSEDEEEAQEQEELWSTLLSWGEALSDGHASFASLPGASKTPAPQRGAEVTLKHLTPQQRQLFLFSDAKEWQATISSGA